MQTYPILAHTLNTAQQYAKTAGNLAEALYQLLSRRPCGTVAPDDAAARTAYAQSLGHWYMENSDLLAAGLTACRLLSDSAALLLDDTRKATKSAPEPPSTPPDVLKHLAQASSLPDPSNAVQTASLPKSASLEVHRQFYRECAQRNAAACIIPAGVRSQRPASTGQPTAPNKKKGRAEPSAEQ